MNGQAVQSIRARRRAISSPATCGATEPGLGSGRPHRTVPVDRHCLPVHRAQQRALGGHAGSPEPARLEEPCCDRAGAPRADRVRPVGGGPQGRIPESRGMACADVACPRSVGWLGLQPSKLRDLAQARIHAPRAVCAAIPGEECAACYAARSRSAGYSYAASSRAINSRYALRSCWGLKCAAPATRRAAYLDLPSVGRQPLEGGARKSKRALPQTGPLPPFATWQNSGGGLSDGNT